MQLDQVAHERKPDPEPPMAPRAGCVCLSEPFEHMRQKGRLDPRARYSIDLDNKTATLSGQEVLIVASLVEREAREASERPMIAGILLRRDYGILGMSGLVAANVRIRLNVHLPP